MKRIICTLGMLLTICSVYSQKSLSISFDLAGKTIQVGNPATGYNGDEVIKVNLADTDNLSFAVQPGKISSYSISIRKGGTNLLTLNPADFQNGKALQTDKTLTLKKVKLPLNFTVIITQGNTILIQGQFAITRTVAAGGTDKQTAQKDQPPVPTKTDLTNNSKPIYKIGSIYYDAISLTNYANLDDSLFGAILAYYSRFTTITRIDSMIAQNPFLKSIFDSATVAAKLNNYNTKTTKAKKGVGSEGAATIASAAFSSIGGLDVTNIVDGLAKFLVKRVKEELSVAFFQKFQKIISDTVHFKDLQTVFPSTYQALNVIGDQIYNYDGYIQSLRVAFEQDLSNLTTNLPSIIDNHAVFFTRPENRKLAAILRSGCYLAGALRDKTHPGDILANYPVDYLDSMPPEWKGAFETLKLISSSLRDTATGPSAGYWVSAQQFRTLAASQTSQSIYLGLIYEQAKTADTTEGGVAPIKFTGSLKLTDILDKVAQNKGPAITFVSQVVTKTGKLETLLQSYKKATSDSVMIQQYYNYFTAAIDLLRQCSLIRAIPAFNTLISVDLAKEMQPYFDVAGAAGNLVLDISKRNYSAAILQMAHIYSVIQADKDSAATTAVVKKTSGKTARQLKKVNAQLTKLNASAAVGGSDSAHKALQASIEKLAGVVNITTDTVKITPGNTKDNIFKYGSFMAAVVLAKNSDDVESAIEAIALPSGSSSIKRETPFNVSLNAYPGLFLGHETIKGVSGQTLNSFGVTATIGVAVSVGNQRFLWMGPKGKGHWSYSLFVSLLDIGAPVAYRFGDTSTAQAPTVQLKDILSPGAFFSIGIPKCPISLNMGAQMGPNLRKVYTQNGTASNTQSNDYAGQTYWRYSLSACVDIPIFNLFTKTQ